MSLLAIGFGVALATAAVYAYKHYASTATVAAVKAEVVKLEASAKADVSAASAEVKAYVAKLEAFVLSVKAKL